MRPRFAWLLVIVFTTCGDGPGDSDSGADASEEDAAVDAPADGPESDSALDAAEDAEPPIDSGPPSDAEIDAPADAALDSGPLPCGLHPVDLALEPVVTGLTLPIFVTQAPDSNDTLWILLKTGLVVLWREGEILPTPFLDIRETIRGTPSLISERGLLGLAFHPDYADNGRFFVAYTHNARPPLLDTVAEYRRGESPEVADPNEVARLMEVDTITTVHNGGHLEFGPDGYLYASLGDGGGEGDPNGNGQNRQTLHGSLLRFDVDNAAGGYIASDAPFMAPEQGLIWAYGLRNPFRYSFDSLTGDLYLSDVGHSRREEVNYVTAGTPPGLNFGWAAFEGTLVYDDLLAPMVTDHTPPIMDYHHHSDDEVVRQGCAITGGVVYRGSQIRELYGTYLYGDFCSRDLGALAICEGELVGHERLDLMGPASISGFGRDNAGEVYLVSHGDLGAVYRLVRQ